MVKWMKKKDDLSVEFIRETFDYDYETGVIKWKTDRRHVSAGDPAGHLMHCGHIKVKINNKAYRAHRLIWVWHYGEYPKYNLHIDHIDGNGANNRIENMRLVTHRENINNREIHRMGKLPGTEKCQTKTKIRWSARIYHDGKKVYLGRYDTEQEAHAAYMEYRIKYNLL